MSEKSCETCGFNNTPWEDAPCGYFCCGLGNGYKHWQPKPGVEDPDKVSSDTKRRRSMYVRCPKGCRPPKSCIYCSTHGDSDWVSEEDYQWIERCLAEDRTKRREELPAEDDYLLMREHGRICSMYEARINYLTERVKMLVQVNCKKTSQQISKRRDEIRMIAAVRLEGCTHESTHADDRARLAKRFLLRAALAYDAATKAMEDNE